MRHTHTYATLAVSRAAFEEIRDKLKEAESTDGFQYLKHQDEVYLIDMNGLALIVEGAE